MKILFIGDLHIGARNSSKVFHDHFTSFFKNVLFPYIKENNVTAVIQLGDTLDKRKSIDFLSSALLNDVWFSFFEENKIPLYSIVGNHDIYFRNSTELTGLNHFKDRYTYIHIIDDIETISIDNCELTLCPWICDSNRSHIEEYIKNQQTWVQIHPMSILCGHFEFAGFQVHRGFISEHDCIDRNLLHRYDRIISGHYHSPSELYIGTPYQITWNDHGDNKRFVVYDTEKREFTDVYTGMEMFHKIYYVDDILVDFNKLKRTYIKLILNTKDISNAKFEMFLTELEEKSHPVSVQVVDNRERTTVDDIDSESIEVDDPLTILLRTIDTVAESESQSILAKEIVKEIAKTVEASSDTI